MHRLFRLLTPKSPEDVLGQPGSEADVGTSRRDFLKSALAAGGGTVLALGGIGSALAAPTDTDIINFGNAAVGAERIGIAFYANALGQGSSFGVSGDLAKGQLLNSAHREYFTAAFNQESQHLATLLGLGLSFGFSVFSFPAGTFNSASSMLAFGEQLESVFIGAYLGAIKVAATVGDSLGVTVAELAGQIVGVECEHRVLIRDIAGQNPPNDRFYEGDQTPGPSSTLGNTGARSTVYASGAGAVSALVALGIQPVS